MPPRRFDLFNVRLRLAVFEGHQAHRYTLMAPSPTGTLEPEGRTGRNRGPSPLALQPMPTCTGPSGTAWGHFKAGCSWRCNCEAFCSYLARALGTGSRGF